VDVKIDNISQDIAIMKVKDVEQSAKLDTLEEKFGNLNSKYHTIDERLKRIEFEVIPKKDMDSLFEKVRNLENAPHEKIISKVNFAKKAVITGVTVLITGAVVSFGTIIWKLIINLDTIIEAIERLRQ
jgi:predicted nuclease with TOPRIM domain